MDDLISRQAFRSRIETEYRRWGEEYDAYQVLSDLDDFPSAQPEQRWIPCSERLPEKCGLYFTTSGLSGETCSRYFNVRANRSFWSGHPKDTVIAWMPLPEPYKPPTRSQYRRMKEQRGEQE